jgi:hypothetical protein
LLYTAEGRPRVSIFSIAHLGDAERMFFVSLLLSQVVSWMRGQTGTSSLRAILYMDEIAGYFPPVANPPSKGPLLTLLKQGRAFGIGVVLATQNPVDLDYKGLSNTGTWFVGRLQTERDKARLLDGLEGVAGGLDRATADRTLSALAKRVFLLHNVHDDRPTVFQTRWTMSYLRGPLSREQIRTLTPPSEARRSPAPAASPASPPPSSTARGAAPATVEDKRPVVPPGIREFFVPPAATRTAAGRIVYTPVALGAARIAFSDRKLGIDVTRDVVYAAPVTDAAVPVDWHAAVRLDIAAADVGSSPASDDAAFAALPPAAVRPRQHAAWEKAFARWLAQAERLALLRAPHLEVTSRPDESERDFRIRVQEAARAARDAAVDALRRKYAPKQAALAERLRRAESAIAREQEQASQQKIQTAVSMGATLLGALLGRRTVSSGTVGRATTTARGVGRSMKEAADVKRAAEGADAIRSRVRELEDEVAAETASIAAEFDAPPLVEPLTLAPRRGHVSVQFVGLGWLPR